MEMVFDLQRRIGQRTVVSCDAPDRPAGGTNTFGNADGMFQDLIDIAVIAARCDLARVINLHADLEYTQNFLPTTQVSHGFAHGTDAASKRENDILYTWYMEQLLRLVDGLDAAVDPSNGGGGTYLDSSVVFATAELSYNNGLNIHPNKNQAVCLVGGCDEYFDTGYHVSYATSHPRNDQSRFIGRAYNQLLVTLMLAMGLTPDQWEPETGEWVGNTIYERNSVGGDEGRLIEGGRRDPLPGIVRS